VGKEQSLRRLSEHRQALAEFNNAYVEYLKAGPQQPGELRSRVLQLMPAAHAAMREAGVIPTMAPPPAIGGPMRIGLENLAFLHESSGIVFAEAPQQVQDGLRIAAATLEYRQRELERRRRNPLYWGDRLVSAVLRFPAYVVGKVIGKPTSTIDRSWWGLALRLLQAVAAALAIFWGGQTAGWW
jgi:hypothetical protein